MQLKILRKVEENDGPLVCPEGDVPEGVEVVGVLPDRLRLLYSSLARAHREATLHRETKTEDLPKWCEIHGLDLALNNLFFYELYSFFGLFGAHGVGISKDWQVYVKVRDCSGTTHMPDVMGVVIGDPEPLEA